MLLVKAFMLEGDPTPHFVCSVLGFQAVRCTLNTCYFVRKSKTFHLSDFNEKHDKRAIKQTHKTTNYVSKDDGACAWHQRNANGKSTQAQNEAVYSNSSFKKCFYNRDRLGAVFGKRPRESYGEKVVRSWSWPRVLTTRTAMTHDSYTDE